MQNPSGMNSEQMSCLIKRLCIRSLTLTGFPHLISFSEYVMDVEWQSFHPGTYEVHIQFRHGFIRYLIASENDT